MRHPKDIGGENTRYDLAIDTGDQLRRVQCKTGRLRKGAVQFNTCSSYAHHPNPKLLKRGYIGEIDDFAVFSPELGAVYLIPVADLRALRRATLRVDPPRNGQRKFVRLAAQYELLRFDVY